MRRHDTSRTCPHLALSHLPPTHREERAAKLDTEYVELLLLDLLDTALAAAVAKDGPFKLPGERPVALCAICLGTHSNSAAPRPSGSGSAPTCTTPAKGSLAPVGSRLEARGFHGPAGTGTSSAPTGAPNANSPTTCAVDNKAATSSSNVASASEDLEAAAAPERAMCEWVQMRCCEQWVCEPCFRRWRRAGCAACLYCHSAGQGFTLARVPGHVVR